MAELKVQVEYDRPICNVVGDGLKWTFPIWGLIMPVSAVTILFYSLCSWLNRGELDIKAIAIMSCCVSLSIISLCAVRLMSVRAITADKNGLLFPPFSKGFSLTRFLPWQNIAKVALLGDSDKPWKSRSLVLYTTGGVVPLKLSRFKPEQIEQLILAIENWGKTTEVTEELKALPKQIQGDEPDMIGASYTEMWEDELKRRFCPANFIPLESGQLVRNNTLRVVRPLATGGFSAVYLCQLEDKKLVVLKESVVPDGTSGAIRDKAAELFDREARTLMKLDHPNIVHVLDHFVEQGRNYMMLEYANGQDLRQHVKQNGAARPESVIEWMIQITGILKYLHEQDPPIIHRDVTPDNLVLRKDGNIMMIDFGAANEFLGTATGTFVGKQAYISPEQFRGKAVVQSDIYSFGSTVHFLLTGEDPLALSTSNPQKVSANVPDELDEIVASCTQLEAADRYQSAAQLLPVLKRLSAIQV
jgi:tRNA A-37 threonylcarbamoyl transferase component Bud32